jgi:hypothetical protein
MHKLSRAFQGPAKFIWPLCGPLVLAARNFIVPISESRFRVIACIGKAGGTPNALCFFCAEGAIGTSAWVEEKCQQGRPKHRYLFV